MDTRLYPGGQRTGKGEFTYGTPLVNLANVTCSVPNIEQDHIWHDLPQAEATSVAKLAWDQNFYVLNAGHVVACAADAKSHD